ncbi:hypothetical protein [uncultured Clostridium sp.]|uniref:hypothetical protein n=1 Tax=uncultured Clostridium sp. TaxID=59620 RepID=UPI0026EB9B49|nr:hypothetical protein [uncultured Clostridium sp.]
MSRSKEELAEEVYNMSDEELNDFAFFALKVMDKRCDEFEEVIYCMAEYIFRISNKYTDVKEVIEYFINIASNKEFDFNIGEFFNEIINK